MKYAFGMLAVLFFAMIALAVYFGETKKEAVFFEKETALLEKEEEEFDFQKFVGKPTTGGAVCVSEAKAVEFFIITLSLRDVLEDQKKQAALGDLMAMIRSDECRMGEHFVPKRLHKRSSTGELMIIEAMGGEDFIVTVWVVATPAALKPLIKEEEAHEVEPPGATPPDPARPPGKIPQGAWQ